MAGVEGQQTVLLLEDHQFVHPSFLEMVNSLLSSGQFVYSKVCKVCCIIKGAPHRVLLCVLQVKFPGCTLQKSWSRYCHR